MVFFLLICIVAVACFAIFRLLAPEMYVRVGPPRFHFPWSRPHLRESPEVSQVQVITDLPPAIDLPLQAGDGYSPSVDKLSKMETLLLEKNTAIERYQQQLNAQRAHRDEFEKIKSILDEEINRLKKQVKTLKKEGVNHA